MKNKALVMYDLEDNFITIFENYKECADYFNTTPKSIQSFMSKVKTGIYGNRKKDKKENRWIKLYKIEDEEDS